MSVSPSFGSHSSSLPSTAILGLGYVGLPLALTFTQAGLQVVGMDTDRAKVALLAAGESPLRDVSHGPIQQGLQSGLLQFTDCATDLAHCQRFILCVPTPLTSQQEPDVGAICAAAASIVPHLQPGTLVVLESTTYPGTTTDLLKRLLEEGSNLQAGIDFCLAYSPEREDPGNPTYKTKDIIKLVGGLTKTCGLRAKEMYEQAGIEVQLVSSPTVAEMAKLLENTFRSVNIALVNELKVLCHRMGIDIFEVIHAAASKPFGFMAFWPGPGTGGHCIPIDPLYLLWQARQYAFTPTLVATAAQINSNMPGYVCERITLGLNRQQRAVSGSQILLVGLAYKRGVEDLRCSPALLIWQRLRQLGASISYHDPLIPWIEDPEQPGQRIYSQLLTESFIEQQHLVVIVTEQVDINYQWLQQHAVMVVDARNVYAHQQQHDNVLSA